jgi:NADH-quinone oxidoreductase subunit M
VGEFLILLGAFKSQFLSNSTYAILGATGVIFAAVYLLWSYQRVFFGRLENPANQKLFDLSRREIAVLVPVVVLIVWIGFFPNTFLEKSAAASRQVVQMVESARTGGGGTVALRPGSSQR